MGVWVGRELGVDVGKGDGRVGKVEVVGDGGGGEIERGGVEGGKVVVE